VSPWLEIGCLLVMLVGLVGVVLPVLPGLALIGAAGLVWVLLDGGGWIRWLTLLAMVVVGGLGYAATWVVPGRATKNAGAPDWVVALGLIGMVVGFFVVPVVGAIVGGLAVIAVVELLRTRDWRTAWRSTWAVVKGFGISTALSFLAGLTMIGIWAAGVWAS
jgi:uncharacterized protein YqgC (DUF456 family)